ncbi:MAG TPA: DUF4881 domain-containing protein [Bryobacteraceae bacterium]|nr:DUF4881 domain-containing protein [Bryobacteraceae bacterium]
MRIPIFIALAALAGCGPLGQVNQGQVVAYLPDKGEITFIADSNYRDPGHPRFDVLPPVTVHVPLNPKEMGPEPEAGRLLALDASNGRAVIYDPAASSFETVKITVVSRHDGVSATDARVRRIRFPVHDQSKGTITVYRARTHQLIEFSVPEQYRGLPDEAWRAGDEIRYYYRDPGRALRLMNVTRTDLSKGEK